MCNNCEFDDYSGWAELRGLCCGKVPGSDGADELQELCCGQYFDDYQGHRCDAGYFSSVEGRHKCDRCELGFHPSRANQSAPDVPPGSRVLKTARGTWSCWW